MSVEIIIMAIVGVFLAVVLFKKSIQDVKNERKTAIEEKVKEVGGEIVVVEQVDRSGCPYSDEYNDPDSTFKFYRIRYSVGDKRKLGYGILKIKQNWYGPSLAATTKWTWNF